MIVVKPGVTFDAIDAGGFRLLSAIDQTSRLLNTSLTITSACDGPHSGPDDPHHKGRAYDIATHDCPTMTAKLLRVRTILQCAIDDATDQVTPAVPLNVAWATRSFYAFLEDPNLPNEHIHVQVRHDSFYPR